MELEVDVHVHDGKVGRVQLIRGRARGRGRARARAREGLVASS